MTDPESEPDTGATGQIPVRKPPPDPPVRKPPPDPKVENE